MQPFGNHALIRRAMDRGGARFIGQANTLTEMTLRSVGPFPALTDTTEGPDAVFGELYEVDAACLADLDRLEGAPHMYDRKEIDVWVTYPAESERGEDGEHRCQTYVWTGEVQRSSHLPIVESGCWIQHRNQQAREMVRATFAEEA
jgi:gamma-glutamylcyclotransferase (GGCT)/AIG2-like uncharacterized protein YtfP